MTQNPAERVKANRRVVGVLVLFESYANVSLWLKADIQSPEIDFRFAPESRH